MYHGLCFKLWTVSGLMLAACAASPAFASGYFTDFEEGAGPEWSPQQTECSVPAFTCFLGRFGNDPATLTLPVTAGLGYELQFDLYIIDTWDGNWPDPPGNDSFTVTVDDDEIFNEYFCNVSVLYGGLPADAWQTFPPPESPREDLGFLSHEDAVYLDITLPFTPLSSEVSIVFQGHGLQALDDESWGIDNISVVPEPATLSLLTLGGLMLARRRR